MNQTNVKVSFYLKKSEADADGNCPVMAKLNIGKYSEAAFSVKMKVPQSRWASGRASGKSVAAKEINNRLDEIRAMALSIYADLSAVRDGVTADEVKNYCSGWLADRKRSWAISGNSSVNNHIERFLHWQYRLSDISFAALDRSFIDKYDLYQFRLAHPDGGAGSFRHVEPSVFVQCDDLSLHVSVIYSVRLQFISASFRLLRLSISRSMSLDIFPSVTCA